jgi:hypothetical protein
MFFVKFAASALNDVPGEKYEKKHLFAPPVPHALELKQKKRKPTFFLLSRNCSHQFNRVGGHPTFNIS